MCKLKWPRASKRWSMMLLLLVWPISGSNVVVVSCWLKRSITASDANRKSQIANNTTVDHTNECCFDEHLCFGLALILYYNFIFCVELRCVLVLTMCNVDALVSWSIIALDGYTYIQFDRQLALTITTCNRLRVPEESACSNKLHFMFSNWI